MLWQIGSVERTLTGREVGPRIFFIFRVFHVFRGCAYLWLERRKD
jgi:hypothetical protein